MKTKKQVKFEATGDIPTDLPKKTLTEYLMQLSLVLRKNNCIEKEQIVKIPESIWSKFESCNIGDFQSDCHLAGYSLYRRFGFDFFVRKVSDSLSMSDPITRDNLVTLGFRKYLDNEKGESCWFKGEFQLYTDGLGNYNLSTYKGGQYSKQNIGQLADSYKNKTGKKLKGIRKDKRFKKTVDECQELIYLYKKDSEKTYDKIIGSKVPLDILRADLITNDNLLLLGFKKWFNFKKGLNLWIKKSFRLYQNEDDSYFLITKKGGQFYQANIGQLSDNYKRATGKKLKGIKKDGRKKGTITYYKKDGTLINTFPLFGNSESDDRIAIADNAIKAGYEDMREWDHYTMHDGNIGQVRPDFTKYCTVDLRTGKTMYDGKKQLL